MAADISQRHVSSMAVYPDYDGWLACGDCHLQLTRDIVIVQQLEEMLMAHAPSCGVEGG